MLKPAQELRMSAFQPRLLGRVVRRARAGESAPLDLAAARSAWLGPSPEEVLAAAPTRERAAAMPDETLPARMTPPARPLAQPAVAEGDVVVRAQAQIVVLRRALEEGARLRDETQASNRRLGECLDAGVRVIEQLDIKTSRAEQAAGVLDRATTTLDALSAITEQVDAARSGLQSFAVTCESEQRAAMEAARSHATKELADAARDIEARVQAAREQSVAEASRIADDAVERARLIEQRVTALVGVPEMDAEDPARSLAEAMHEGTSLLKRVEDSVLRIAMMAGDADEIRESVATALAEGAEFAETHAMQMAELRASMDQGIRDAAAASEQILRSSEENRAVASGIEKSTAQVRELAGMLDALRVSTGAQIERSRAAEESLRQTIEQASGAAQAVSRCLEQVTSQAGDLVRVARDVASLIARAEGVLAPESRDDDESDDQPVHQAA
jgi:hypothetical protein